VPLEYDKLIVNKGGSIGLFFAGILTKTVPSGTKVKFEEISKGIVDDESQYVVEGELDVLKADTILSRLEKEGIRFQIDTDEATRSSARGGTVHVRRLTLYVHVDDVPAWEKIRTEYFPE